MIFQQYEIIRIVNLAHRDDRRREMNGELRKVGLAGDARVQFFDACAFDDAGDFYSRGARGCYESHVAILREAAATGASVLILEDDADFVPGAESHVIPDGTHIFYGGYTLTSDPNPLVSDIVGSHMMGFSAEIVPRILHYFDTLSYEGKHPPVDAAYIWYRRAFPDVATHFAVPPIAHQRPSRTDIGEARFFDKLPILREIAGGARKLKRAISK